MYVDWPEPVCSYRVGNLALAAATPICPSGSVVPMFTSFGGGICAERHLFPHSRVGPAKICMSVMLTFFSSQKLRRVRICHNTQYPGITIDIRQHCGVNFTNLVCEEFLRYCGMNTNQEGAVANERRRRASPPYLLGSTPAPRVARIKSCGLWFILVSILQYGRSGRKKNS